jgi:cytoskeletal protein CcmA (bactofilin family)
MSQPKPRFLEAGAVSPTFIGGESVFVGNIRGSGQFVVSGEIHGDGDIGGLNLAKSARWHGHILARQAIVAGEIIGSLTVEETLQVGDTAVIRGKVSARAIAIAKGAIIEGEIEVTSDVPLVRFEANLEGGS